MQAAHLVDRVHPRKVGALDPHSLHAAGQMIEDLHRLVGDGDLVGIREAQNDAQLARIATEAGSGPRFLTYEPCRLPDAREDRLECAVEPRYSQRLSEPASAITLLVEAGAPFSK